MRSLKDVHKVSTLWGSRICPSCVDLRRYLVDLEEICWGFENLDFFPYRPNIEHALLGMRNELCSFNQETANYTNVCTGKI
jgi:glutaredoxin-related protein